MSLRLSLLHHCQDRNSQFPSSIVPSRVKKLRQLGCNTTKDVADLNGISGTHIATVVLNEAQKPHLSYRFPVLSQDSFHHQPPPALDLFRCYCVRTCNINKPTARKLTHV